MFSNGPKKSSQNLKEKKNGAKKSPVKEKMILIY